MVKNKINHKESVTENLQQLTSNTGPLLPTPPLWFHLSWVYLIIMPLIMVMSRSPLQSFQLNLTLNLFQIQTPLQLNQSMMMKYTISWNSSTQNNMQIFWMLTYICFSIEWWSPLLKSVLQSLLCCFINTEE